MLCCLFQSKGAFPYSAKSVDDDPVIREQRITLLRTCNTKETAIVACQLEKDKVPVAERSEINAVVMDDGGYEDIMF